MSAAVKRNGRAACGAVVFGFALLLRLTVALLVMFLAFFFTLARLALAFFNFAALTGESFQRWQTMTVIRTQAGTEPIDASKPPPPGRFPGLQKPPWHAGLGPEKERGRMECGVCCQRWWWGLRHWLSLRAPRPTRPSRSTSSSRMRRAASPISRRASSAPS